MLWDFEHQDQDSFKNKAMARMTSTGRFSPIDIGNRYLQVSPAVPNIFPQQVNNPIISNAILSLGSPGLSNLATTVPALSGSVCAMIWSMGNQLVMANLFLRTN